jgi:Lrp/AsnC family leucine-responsive transcriptional regulator
LPKARRNGGASLDERDLRLLALLEADARAPLAELARGLSISPQSLGERLKRLQDLGVLAGFSPRIDPRALGLEIGAYVRIQPALGELSRVAEIVRSIPEIVECDRITGEDCFIAKVFVARVEDLEGVIDRLIPYARTNTSIIQSSPVPRRSPRYA